MATALAEAFARAAREGRLVFIPFITAGFPSPADTVPILLAMEKAGADVIELGVPFSDPLADGPIIQVSNTQSLKHGTSYADCLRFVREARAKGLRAPVVLMGYVNPLLAYGPARAVSDAKDAGANGFIVVDLPLEEEPEFFKACKQNKMSFVPLVAPTTTDARLALLVAAADTFLYCVSITGVTGQRDKLSEELPGFVARVRRATKLPIAIGFGISTAQHVAEASALADGVVVGSAVIKAVLDAKGADPAAAVAAYIASVLPPRK